MSEPVVVVEYDPQWPRVYEELRQRVGRLLGGVACRIEHVGSTAVPGLAAKPVVDVDVVVDAANVPRTIAMLEAGGYLHRGNLGIEGREAFAAPARLPRHNLYVCVDDGRALRNHVTFRDHLRAHAEAREAYEALKRELARRFPNDIESYAKAKTEFVLGVLRAYGLPPDDLSIIEDENLR